MPTEKQLEKKQRRIEIRVLKNFMKQASKAADGTWRLVQINKATRMPSFFRGPFNEAVLKDLPDYQELNSAHQTIAQAYHSAKYALEDHYGIKIDDEF